MPLFNITQQQYYDNSQTLVSNGNAELPPLTFNPLPTSEIEFDLLEGGARINFKHNKNMTISTMREFKRKLQF